MTTENLTTQCLITEDFDAPIDDRYFEDYAPGARFEFGSIVVAQQDILSFARQFDPQPIHLDPAYQDWAYCDSDERVTAIDL